MATENPRWAACRIALGHEPSNCDFICWMHGELADYCDEHGLTERYLHRSKPEDVTAWLFRRAKAQAVAREKGVA